MPRRLVLFVLLLIGIVVPSMASARTLAEYKTRVWGFDLAAHALVGGSNARTAEKHPENPNAYDENASGSPLAAEGAVAEAGGASELPTFLNRGSPRAGTVLGPVTEGGGTYSLPSGPVPAGSYDFVRQNGQLIVGRGHYALSGGGAPVEFAGEVTFGEGGQLMSWTNASGHYRPAAAFAGNAGLPLGAFRAVSFPGFVGVPQVPMFRSP